MNYEDGIIKAVQSVGFNVNKEELAKALLYDRGQYEKGYADGRPPRGEWIEDGEGEIYCSKCGKYTYDRHDEIKEFDGKTVIALCYPRFCGNCGAMMERREDER